MIEEVKVDLSYIEEIFETRQECIHFLMLMQAEFQEAKELIYKSILEQNLYTLRKTLHNLNTHLEMLGNSELSELLRKVKSSIAGKQLTETQKQEMADEVAGYFSTLLRILTVEIQRK